MSLSYVITMPHTRRLTKIGKLTSRINIYYYLNLALDFPTIPFLTEHKESHFSIVVLQNLSSLSEIGDLLLIKLMAGVRIPIMM